MLFKVKNDEEVAKKDLFSFESTDQENLIKLISEFAPAGRSYRYSIMLINQSKDPITEIKIRIKFPDVLELIRNSPGLVIGGVKALDKGIEQINLEFEELAEDSKRQLNFYFTPKALNQKGKISTNITFVNNKDFVRVLNSEPTKIEIGKLSIMPKIIPGFHIQKFLQNSEIKKSLLSLGIGVEEHLNLLTYFHHIERILQHFNFHLIAKDEEKKIAWFFGTDIELNEDILVIGQIVINKIEFLAASKNHQILISLLSALNSDYRKRILSTGVVQTSDHIYNLDCKNCGGALPYFPIQGEEITCKHCQTVQLIW